MLEYSWFIRFEVMIATPTLQILDIATSISDHFWMFYSYNSLRNQGKMVENLKNQREKRTCCCLLQFLLVCFNFLFYFGFLLPIVCVILCGFSDLQLPWKRKQENHEEIWKFGLSLDWKRSERAAKEIEC
ncbi:hypothetical protein I3760_16G057300 [Carya illinoinensis]|uniref:Transmembrane protein n=1 Tax=Carya illinoinensis TaxID=32201 RepID=A0A922G3S8_CARIL|nr:hypothetical protein I3760_16G057300 [Carya illinoinensis]KAG6689343.1 hypothetical protein I3842_11G169800 [Carya illinoinensis]KAG6731982.1 hypothetical protein I3842_01G154300 [Carya illinoinensis]